MIQSIKNFFNNFSSISIALFVMVFILVLVTIWLNIESDNETPDNQQDILDSTASSNPQTTSSEITQRDELIENNFNNASELLQNLPYTGDGFTINTLPYGVDETPILIVTITKADGLQASEEWLSLFSYNADNITIEYNEQASFATPPYGDEELIRQFETEILGL